MNRYTLLATLLLALSACSNLSQAQGVNPAPPSNSFNYLNLNRGGNPAVNYYGIVRPNTMNQNAWASTQQQINAFSNEENANNDPNAIRSTGRGATYMNYGHYYPRAGAGRPGGNSGARR